MMWPFLSKDERMAHNRGGPRRGWYMGAAMWLVMFATVHAYINAGFNNYSDYANAKRLGIDNADDYYAYKRGASIESLKAARRIREATGHFTEAIERNRSDPVAY